ncbi:cadherin repeat domain-containing protein [Erythrobacter sp. NFXS35]|uniref:cadherin repeat domain-containing protein n=1 Tax=Erythrobacter sp. NFXS35 TaxID=2818436 RepID=UPI0032DF0560
MEKFEIPQETVQYEPPDSHMTDTDLTAKADTAGVPEGSVHAASVRPTGPQLASANIGAAPVLDDVSEVDLASDAALSPEPAAEIKLDFEKERDEEDEEKAEEETEQAPDDLAIDPTAEMMEAVAAADGARAAPELDGEASALLGDGFNPILFVPAAALVAGGIALAASGDDDDDLPFEPEPEPQAPVITSPATAEFAEDIEVGTVVYTATATDADSATITFSLEGDDADLFTIDAETGEVVLNEPADFETLQGYDFTVVATDPEGNQDTQEVTLTVTDVNEAPVFTIDPEAIVLEDAAEGDLVIDPIVIDPEGGEITLTLEGNDADDFTVNADGEVVFADGANLDQGVYNVTLVAADPEGNETRQSIVVINEISAENQAPVITSDDNVTMAEGIVLGSAVYVAAALDPEAEGLIYSLQDTDGGRFTIDPLTGTVLLAQELDFESAESHTFTVVATDPAGNQGMQTVTLNVTNDPEVDLDTVEDSDPSTPVVDVDAADGDVLFVDDPTVENEVLIANFEVGDRIELTQDAELEFSVDGNDLIIESMVNGAVASSITLDEVLVGVANPEAIVDEATAEAALGYDFLNVPDDGDEAPLFVTDEEVTVPEDLAIGALVYTVRALDPEAEGVLYSLEDTNNGRFTIDPVTGQVFLVSELDFETDANPSFTVLATDPNGNQTSETVTLNVTDAPDMQVDLETATDLNPGTPVVDLDATGGGFLFLEDPTASSEVSIAGFGTDDRIEVTGEAVVDFAATGDDLVIQSLADGELSSIVLEDVLSGVANPAAIVDEATAEAALGFDFFSQTQIVDTMGVAA